MNTMNTKTVVALVAVVAISAILITSVLAADANACRKYRGGGGNNNSIHNVAAQSGNGPQNLVQAGGHDIAVSQTNNNGND